MSMVQAACPSCSLPLQSSRPLDAGKRLRCPRCKTEFSVSPPCSIGQPASPRTGRSGTGWIGLLLGILLLAGALGAARLLHSSDDRPSPVQLASAEDSSPVPQAPSSLAAPAAPVSRPTPTRAEPPPLPAPSTGAPRPSDAGRPAEAKPAPPPARRDPERLPAAEPTPATDPTPKRPESAVKGWLPPEEQERVDAAIARGIQFLKNGQQESGSWEERNWLTGTAALPALALLECGLPADDPMIQKAARCVRDQAPQLKRTYEIALAILFLDRLQDSRDEEAIRSLALRLIAGQESKGGWTYTCPLLSTDEEESLMIALKATKPRSPLDLFVQVPGDRSSSREPLDTDLSRPGRDGLSDTPRQPARDPERLNQTVEMLPAPIQQRPGGSLLPLSRELGRAGPGGLPALPPRPARAPQARMPSPAEPEEPSSSPEVEKLPLRLRHLPALQPPQRYQRRTASKKSDRGTQSDNSNTQFAILGLWAARRHGVPMDRALGLMTWRFQTSQNDDGSWSYKYVAGGDYRGRPSMTGSALLGLAVGQGLTYDYRRNDEDRQPLDQRARRGLAYLANAIEPGPGGVFPVQERRGNRKGPPAAITIAPEAASADFDAYLLWTIERVAMLYNLRHMQGRDWYRSGAMLLLDVQEPDGSWPYGRGQSRPVVGTSFGLLFLKGSNLVPDLTRRLKAVQEATP